MFAQLGAGGRGFGHSLPSSLHPFAADAGTLGGGAGKASEGFVVSEGSVQQTVLFGNTDEYFTPAFWLLR